ncbi:hypothetical protein IWT140_01077 [Secundilactobacillus pentosiphilus]|uniref:Uncharacterized protein n=1 Tax=Secundilactobacillus pentosiphilus TaxID=1714682 RepID=A0A1Z5IP03_9LACO|nr:hypothetical protein IWT140_01077 [Secundilactobacillus pentosiphilus]
MISVLNVNASNSVYVMGGFFYSKGDLNHDKFKSETMAKPFS